MNTWKVILATVVIFITGAVTGGLLVRYAEQRETARPERGPGTTRPPQPGSPAGLRMDFLKRMQRELDLSPEQRQRIDKILKEHQEEIKKITEPIQPDIQEQIQAARDEFLEVLTPEQRARFEESLKRQQHPKERPHPPERQPSPGAAAPTNSLPAATKAP